jgi:membrane protein YdbS with pleckstrin-like domain
MEFNFAEFKVVFFKDSVEIRKVHFFKNSFNKSIITLFLLLPIAIGYNYLFPSNNNLILFYISMFILIILALILNLFLMYSFRIIM